MEKEEFKGDADLLKDNGIEDVQTQSVDTSKIEEAVNTELKRQSETLRNFKALIDYAIKKDPLAKDLNDDEYVPAIMDMLKAKGYTDEGERKSFKYYGNNILAIRIENGAILFDSFGANYDSLDELKRQLAEQTIDVGYGKEAYDDYAENFLLTYTPIDWQGLEIKADPKRITDAVSSIQAGKEIDLDEFSEEEKNTIRRVLESLRENEKSEQLEGLRAKDAELASLESEAQVISDAESLMRQQEGQGIGE